MKYYRLLDNLEIDDRWFIGELENIEWDFWQYLYAKPLDEKPNKPIAIELQEKGSSLDFTYAAFEIPIVNQKVKELFSEKDVNFYPVANKAFKENYFLMHILNEVECVDEENSTFDKFEENDPVRPDKAGSYSVVYKLKIRKDIEYKNEIFRIRHYDVAVIVSERIKSEFEKLDLKGVVFEEVS